MHPRQTDSDSILDNAVSASLVLRKEDITKLQNEVINDGHDVTEVGSRKRQTWLTLLAA